MEAKLSDKIFDKEKIRNTRKPKMSDKVFDAVIVVITTISALICLLPVLNMAAVSLSSNSAIISSKVLLWPVEFTIDSYRAIFADKSMMWSMAFTIIITVIYTVVSMALTIAAAYPLSKKGLKGRSSFLLVIVITMYFTGGIIPDYILIRDLGLLNKMWSLILPGAISAFNLILLKSFFNSLPEGLEEAARIDGCTDFGVLIRVVLPLSLPIIATLSLFYAVGKWNSFMDALFYITDPKMYPLQLKLYQIIANSQSLESAFAEGNMSPGMLPDSLKAASVMFATIPIVCIYPFIQRHFIKGVMLGAIKE
jgi:putative aldouronate transport system permease protein